MCLAHLNCSPWNTRGFSCAKTLESCKHERHVKERQKLSMGQQLLFYNTWLTLVFLKTPWKLMQWHNWVPAAKAYFLGKCTTVDQQLRKPGSKAWSSLGWALGTQNRKGQILITPLTKPTVLSTFFCISLWFLQDFSLNRVWISWCLFNMD